MNSLPLIRLLLPLLLLLLLTRRLMQTVLLMQTNLPPDMGQALLVMGLLPKRSTDSSQ